MTLLTTASKVSYSGNGSAQVFSFPYKFPADEDLTVILRTVATGAETPQVLNTDFTVSGADNPVGGTVTMLAAPAVGETLTILRTTGATQLVDFVDNDALSAAALEGTLDRLAMAIQTALEVVGRAVVVPYSDKSNLSTALASSVARASKYLGFNSAGEPVALDPPALGSADMLAIGPTAPPHASGRFWIDTGTVGGLTVSTSDGTDWIVVGTVDTATNTFAVSLTGITPAAIGAEPTLASVSAKTATAAKGSTARPLADHLSNVYDVKNYGAVGDGVADDAAAINAAITAAAVAGGGAVYFPVGTFRVTTSVLPLSNTTLMGGGPNSIIKLADAANTHTVSMSAGTSNVLINNLKVDGNRANQTTQAGVGIRAAASCSNIEIRDCIVVNAKNQGIASFGTSGNSVTDFTVRGCTVDTCGSHGIYCGDVISRVLVESCTVTNWGIDIAQRPAITVGHGAGNHYRVVNNHVFAAGGTGGGGISIDRVSRGVVSGNVIDDTSSWGIEIVDGADDAVVSNNKIENVETQGIAIQGNVNGSPERIVVTGNNIRLAGDNGIRVVKGLAVAGPVGLIVSNNVIHQSADRGIDILDALQAVVGNNIVRLSENEGIRVQTSDNVIIGGNVATNNNQAAGAAQNIKVANTVSESDFIVLGNGASSITVDNTVDVNTNNATGW